MRILLVTRSYPSAGDLYQYPFVHRRVLAYVAAGHEVAVFRPASGTGEHAYQGVRCISGDGAALLRLTAEFEPQVVAAHGFSEEMWDVLKPLAHLPIRAWLHGSEIPGFFRAKAECLQDAREREATLAAVQARRKFWAEFLDCKPPRFSLVFVSESAACLAAEDMAITAGDFAVIHNPIDTELFAYRPKAADHRKRVLMIRPFDSQTYGNDLAIAAIDHLRARDGFDQVQFTIIGDGAMFDEVVAPLRGLANVSLERRFLKQEEIAKRHGDNGIFLVPTRLDTQGVSRDEAMSSGLVPVTNCVSAVPEFVDESCAGLAGGNDSQGMAKALWELVEDPNLFLAKSRAAAERVRRQSAARIIIPEELALLAAAAKA